MKRYNSKKQDLHQQDLDLHMLSPFSENEDYDSTIAEAEMNELMRKVR